MELLSVDIGNTRTGFSLMRNGKVLRRWNAQTRDAGRELIIPGDIGSLLDRVLEVGICSVVPEVTWLVSRQLASLFGIEPWIVESERISWFALEYEPLSSLGADRICTVIAARERAPWPVVVVDCGTATTFSVVNEAGDFTGGVIAPGFDMLAAALASGTAQLPLAGDEMPHNVLAKNTNDAVREGTTRLFVSGISGILESIETEFDGDISVVLTGGRGEWLRECLGKKYPVEPDLVHLGVYEYARRIRAKA